jgi:predicted transcriptional regulator
VKGAPVTVACSKRKLTSLTKAAAKVAAAREQERAEAKAEREVARVAEQLGVDESTARDAIEANADLAPDTLEGFAALGLDQQGELVSRHPRKGGMSVGAIRAMMEADGYDVPPKMRKSDLVDMLLALVSIEGPVATPVSETESNGKVISLASVADDLEVQF